MRIDWHDDAMHDLLESAHGPTGVYLAKVATRVEARAKRLCPVDTGRLRSSITSALEQDGDTIVAMVGTDVEYATFVEFGTSRTAPQPFLLPALATIL